MMDDDWSIAIMFHVGSVLRDVHSTCELDDVCPSELVRVANEETAKHLRDCPLYLPDLSAVAVQACDFRF